MDRLDDGDAPWSILGGRLGYRVGGGEGASMIKRYGSWWRAVLAGTMLATASLGGCSGTIVHAPSDAAVSDLVVIDTPLVTCNTGTIRCGATCVDTATDVSHCGTCNLACETGWSCVMGTCACTAGRHRVGAVCVADDAPRPLAPISLGDVTQRRPTLRWALPPGIDGAVVELCRDRACMSILETLRVTGTSARPTADLPARSTVFWRMRGRAGTVERTGASPTWIFHVPARSASTTVDTSFNPHFDINGDGFDDIVVGAQASLGRPYREGAASVFYGSATRTQPAAGTARTPDRFLQGAAEGDEFGISVAGAGDVNGDGYADLVVGAHWADPGGRTSAGTASVFYGSATWTQPAVGTASNPDRLLEGAAEGDGFGWSVASAGDINGDGYADLVVGADTAWPGGRVRAGTASVFYGSATWTQPVAGTASNPDRRLEGVAAFDFFGLSVSSAGDINGDGYADLVVGARRADPDERIAAGTASVFYGSATWAQPAAGTARTPDRLLLLEGAAADDDFEASVASAGDVNGDGYADLVVGATLAEPGGRRFAGTASVYYGSATWTQPAVGTARTPDRLLEGAAGEGFGASVASAGDVNGDGYSDLVVGAPRASPGGRGWAGTASVFYGSATWTQPPAGTASTPDHLLEGASAEGRFGGSEYRFGASVASAGDVNGDGYADLVVGAPRASPGGRVRAGTASVFYGSATWTQPPAGTASTPDRRLEGVGAYEFFGRSVASAGDINGDGYPDLVVGAYFAGPGGRSREGTPFIPDRVLGSQCLHPSRQFSHATVSPSNPVRPFRRPCPMRERWTCATVDSQHADLPQDAFTRPVTDALVVDRPHDRSPRRVRPAERPRARTAIGLMPTSVFAQRMPGTPMSSPPTLAGSSTRQRGTPRTT
ncbi:MAG: FG-GAP-like repeat-containing protein [Deltaproteobacteria bacterium]|nr:FG-GAP-like repeat-containing protein [Myxococcales bacterium]MDP3212759.1 FG-GAP-like repeat-containing protein [Deltaproteobacteria bacterium]